MNTITKEEVGPQGDYSFKRYMEYDSGPSLKERKIWLGRHRGINFEINNFHTSSMNGWTHYIYIRIDDQLPEEFKEKFWLPPTYYSFREGGAEYVRYDFYDSVIRDLKFHGGCTWYSKETCVDEKKRIVKIGCDYQHIWDEGSEYDLSYVHSEVKNTIDSLWALVGEIKIRNWGDGSYRKLEEYK